MTEISFVSSVFSNNKTDNCTQNSCPEKTDFVKFLKRASFESFNQYNNYILEQLSLKSKESEHQDHWKIRSQSAAQPKFRENCESTDVVSCHELVKDFRFLVNFQVRFIFCSD